MNNNVAVVHRDVVLVQKLLGLTQFGHVKASISATNVLIHQVSSRGTRQGIKDDLVLPAADGIGNHLDQLLALVKVNLGLVKNVCVLCGVKVRQINSGLAEGYVERSNVGLGNTHGGDTLTDSGKFNRRTLDTTTLTNRSNQLGLSLVGLLYLCVEERNKCW